ncbi:baseplate complex protein [Pseudomonas sp. CCOS 191]|uniref:baseplate complex protein n=1 Tax=Pseudomonas sp. CCOS 191 TaxID=1649877 RepID=UPI0018E67AAA|nr:DNA-binding protein [Pseudomonas sp. CCOS 191]MBI6955481.1 DNA-binding protein [Pseudomonas sp. CCOS 191]
MTLLLLDGQPVEGKTLKVTGNLRIEAEDLSGQTSNTDTAHKGFKPKTLTVTLTIPYVNSVWLRNLMRLAEATQSGGQLKTYRIVNDTAEAFGIRQVCFADNVNVREDDALACWRVQFGLAEKTSNPEKVEKRRAKKRVKAQAAPGAAAGAEDDEDDKDPKLTSFEKLLKKVDDWLGEKP